MVLLRDVGPVEARINPFGDNVNLNARSVHGLRRMYHRLRNHFERIRWYSYMTCVKWKVISIHLETMLISTQDRCTVCIECNIGSENHFGRTRWYTYMTWIKLKLILVHLETVLMSTQDRCTVCVERVIDLEIILEAPNGTPTVHVSSGGSLGSVSRYCSSWHKIGARFVPNIPQTWKSFWVHQW
jgi:hypothetical protein